MLNFDYFNEFNYCINCDPKTSEVKVIFFLRIGMKMGRDGAGRGGFKVVYLKSQIADLKNNLF